MTRLSADTTIDVIEQFIAEGEARRAEQLLLLKTQAQADQDLDEAQQMLRAIDDALQALRCRRSYLQAMQEKP